MFLTSINLTNFRNFKKKTFSFVPAVTSIVGDNTKGKTSICEAIFYLASGKSFRADKDNEVISWGEEIGRVSAKCEVNSTKPDEQEFLEIIFTDRKQFLVNGVGKRMVDFAGNLKAVLFRPEDMDLIIGSPSLRRRYLDFVLIQTDREYRRAVISYEKGVRQRNRLLEKIRDEAAYANASASQGGMRNQLLFWDQLLIKNGNYISNKRAEYIEYINGKEKNLGNYEAIYDDSQISTARLEQYLEAEIASGNTLIGPHRDDFKIELRERDLAVFGSRGEQRLAVLWLKLCELSFIREKSGERPILLLDDIFSELDHKHRDLVFEIMDNQQTIVTSADPHLIQNGVEMEIIRL